MSTVRILHIIPAFGGGISSYVKNLIVAANDDLIMDIVGFGTFPKNYIDEIADYSGKVYSLPSVHCKPIKMIKIYSKILKQNRYDIVHCHFSGYKGAAFKILARINKIQCIAVHAHRTDDENKGLLYPIIVWLSRILSRVFADYYFTCSGMAADFVYGSKFCRKHKVVMMPNSINPHLYEREMSNAELHTYKTELNLKPDSIVIGHVGRFNMQKNHVFMLDIIEQIIKIDQRYILLLIGDGELKAKIEKEVKARGLKDCVKFLGVRKDVNKILKLMDVFILPSLFEGLPTVAVEAQAAGTPILMSDTITPEADLGIGYARYLPINQGIDCWCDAIERINEIFKTKNDTEKRMEALDKQGFTNTAMRRRYSELVHSFVEELEGGK